MSDSIPPPNPHDPASRPTPPTSARSGCLTAFLILAGIVLLLPGLCAIALVAFDWKSALSGSTLPAVLIFLAISAGGIIMIREGVRGPRR
jgi:hypothetical protein